MKKRFEKRFEKRLEKRSEKKFNLFFNHFFNLFSNFFFTTGNDWKISAELNFSAVFPVAIWKNGQKDWKKDWNFFFLPIFFSIFISTLVCLLSKHVRLIIFRKISGLCGLNRYCSLNYFWKKFQFPSFLTLIDISFYLYPVRLIGTVRLTFFLKFKPFSVNRHCSLNRQTRVVCPFLFYYLCPTT